MKIAVLIARVLLGLVFLIFGINTFHPFMPMQLPPGDAGVFAGLLFTHKWFLFIGVLYIIGGLLLIIGRFVPIGLVILGPILVNILLFHVTFAPEGIVPGLVCAALELFLIYAYRAAFQGLFLPHHTID
jgi:putative oxidoreductase